MTTQGHRCESMRKSQDKLIPKLMISNPFSVWHLLSQNGLLKQIQRHREDFIYYQQTNKLPNKQDRIALQLITNQFSKMLVKPFFIAILYCWFILSIPDKKVEI